MITNDHLYREQVSMSDAVLRLKLEEAAKSIDGIVSEYYSYHSSDGSICFVWKDCPKAYLLNIRNDKTLDPTGQKLYDGIVDLLGKERADEYITSSDSVLFKRLSVCVLGNIALGLIEDNSRIRLAATKKLKASGDSNEC